MGVDVAGRGRDGWWHPQQLADGREYLTPILTCLGDETRSVSYAGSGYTDHRSMSRSVHTVRCTHGKACALRRHPHPRLLDKATSHREEEDRLVTDALLDPGKTGEMSWSWTAPE